MQTRPTRYLAYAAASALGLITLAVFFELQDYGPESAIRRFHNDVADRDATDLQRVTMQPIDSAHAQELEQWVSAAQRQGARYELVRMDRTPDQVRAAVVYRFPNGPDQAMIWVVERTGRLWRVNVDKTMTIIEDLSRSG